MNPAQKSFQPAAGAMCTYCNGKVNNYFLDRNQNNNFKLSFWHHFILLFMQQTHKSVLKKLLGNKSECNQKKVIKAFLSKPVLASIRIWHRNTELCPPLACTRELSSAARWCVFLVAPEDIQVGCTGYTSNNNLLVTFIKT